MVELLLTNTITNFGNTGINPLNPPGKNPEDYGALIAMPCQGQPLLIEFPASGFQPEVKTDDLWYASMGSGQLVADPLLGFIRTTFWEDNSPPPIQEGVFAATMVLKLGCDMAPVAVSGPIRIAILGADSEKNGQLSARRLAEEELAEHQQSVEDAIEHLRGYREVLHGKSSAALESLPSLPDL